MYLGGYGLVSYCMAWCDLVSSDMVRSVVAGMVGLDGVRSGVVGWRSVRQVRLSKVRCAVLPWGEMRRVRWDVAGYGRVLRGMMWQVS